MSRPLPTFQEVRQQHQITLNRLIEDDPCAVLLLDTWSIGEATIIAPLLASLSRLSGTPYRRNLLTIGSFSFSPNPPDEQIPPETITERDATQAEVAEKQMETERRGVQMDKQGDGGGEEQVQGKGWQP